MTLTEYLKILDEKKVQYKADKAHNDLDREEAKISLLSSGELEKYEYLTGEDLGYKPDANQKAKFKYFSLAGIFNKGVGESDKKEGLLKRLKNSEGKDEQQLVAIRDHVERRLKATKNKKKLPKMIEDDRNIIEERLLEGFKFLPNLSQDVKKAYEKIVEINDGIDYNELICVNTNGKLYDFNKYKKLGDLLRTPFMATF